MPVLHIWRHRHASFRRARPSRLVALLGVIVITAFLVFSGIALWHLHNQALADAERELTNLSRALSEPTARTFQGVDQIARAEQEQLNAENRRSTDPGQTYARLRRSTLGAPHIGEIFVLDSEGRVTHSSYSHPPPSLSAEHRSFFLAHRDTASTGPYISEPRENRALGDWTLWLSRRTEEPGGKFAGVVVVSVWLRYFQELYHSIDLGTGAAMALYRDDGILLVSYPERTAPSGQPFGHVKSFASGAANAIGSQIRSGSEADGKPYLSVLKRVDGFPLVIEVSVSGSTLLAEWRDSVWIIGGGALLTAMLLAFLAAMLAKQFARHEADEQRLRHNETLLHEAQHIAHLGSWSYDRASRRLSCSRETYRILGLDPTATPSRKDILRCTHADDRRFLLRAASAAFEGKRVNIEFRVACDQRNVRWVQLRTEPPLGIRDEPGLLRGTLLDITEHKEAEASRAQLATIVESTEDAIASLSLDGEILSWNRGAQRIYGYAAHEVIGKKMSDLLPPDQQTDTRRLLELVQHGKSLEQYETARRTKGGETIYVALTVSPIMDHHDRIVAASMIARDITARRNARVCRIIEHAVTRALLEAESIGQALSHAIQIICRSLGWDYGVRWQRHGQKHVLQACEVWHTSWINAAELVPDEIQLASAGTTPKHGLLLHVLNSGKPVWRADARHDPDFLRAAQAAKAGLRSVFMFPIVSNSGPIGVMEFLGRESRQPDNVLLEAMETIGSQIGLYIERKHAEEARLAADARLQRITANVPGVVFQCKRAADGSLSFPFISERVYDFYEERAADIIANPMLLFTPVPQEQRMALAKSMLRSKRTGNPWSFETLIRCRNGTRKWIRGQASVSFGDDGSVFWDGVLSDITLQKRAEIDILTANEKLERRVAERTRQLEMMNKELEAFSYSVSHDLRAPLRAVEGFSRLLQQKHGHALDEGANDYLQRIQRAALRMNELVDDLLKLARISRSEIKRVAVDLSAMAREVLKELADTAPGRAVNVDIEEGAIVNGDARLLRIVMENLLGNAWKFTQKESSPNIALGTATQDGKKVIFISDNGAGFDMTRAQKLFGAFQRLHRASDFEGTGIGLAIVQRIVALHGGRVWARSLAGQGATFYFSL